MALYNHTFDLAFSLDSNTEDGSDVTPAMMKAALLSRIDDLDETGEWSEACGLCDTYEYSEQ